MVGPIIRPEVLRCRVSEGEHILVYISSPEAYERLLPVLQKLKYKVIVYGFHISNSRLGNIVFKEPGIEEFLTDLASASAVISNGGYNVMCEAMYFSKPLYSIPIYGQYEQIINSFYLQNMNFGLYDLNPSLGRIQLFLNNQEFYKQNIMAHRGNFAANELLFKLLDKKIGEIIVQPEPKYRQQKAIKSSPGIKWEFIRQWMT